MNPSKRQDVAALFATACRAHQEGRLHEAEDLYRQVLQVDPEHGQAWYLLGAARQALGKTGEALVDLRQALRKQPDNAAAHNLLGVLLAQQGYLEEAVDCFGHALVLRPELPDVRRNLELACARLEPLPRAIPVLEQALRLRPHDAGLHYRLGLLFAKRGQLAEAAAALRQALQLEPDHAEAQLNLGVAYLHQNQLDAAAECFRHALRLRPGWAEAHNGLGVVSLRNNRLEQAAACFQEAVQARPDLVQAHTNLGQTLVRLDRLEKALGHFQHVLSLDPDLADGHCQKGYALALAGQRAEALASFEKALQIQPDHADAHFERALVWLLEGDWRRGFAEYEWRDKTGRFPESPFRLPRWDGAPLAGRTILLHAEQGFGDTFHFIRYAPLVKERGGTVVVACPGSLIPLLSRSPGIDRLVADVPPAPPCDVQASLASLPFLLNTTIDNLPALVPYLFPDPVLVEQWHRELPPSANFRIGIVWQGNPGYRKDNLRSPPLRHFAHLAELAGVRLYSLQKGHGTQQLPEFAERVNVVDLGHRLSERAGAFTDTAAALKNLDLLVTSDTAIAHLAGGLGVPVFLALPLVPDWRWLLERADTPWYPTMRLFRQTERGNWEAVFQRLGEAVRSLLAAR